MKLTGILQDMMLYEGLIHSYEIGAATKILNNWSVANDKFNIQDRQDNTIRLNFIENLTKSELDNLVKLVNTLGWFIAMYAVNDYDTRPKKYKYDQLLINMEKYKLQWMILETKYDLELNKYKISELYHVSPVEFKNKIEKLGLVPKSQSKIATHPERIYFTKNVEDAKLILAQFKALKGRSYNIYKIDVIKLRRQNNGIRFFSDPAFPNKGIYTLSNVPHDCITLIDTL